MRLSQPPVGCKPCGSLAAQKPAAVRRNRLGGLLVVLAAAATPAAADVPTDNSAEVTHDQALAAAAGTAERQQSPFTTCARPDIAATICDKYNDLGGWPSRDKLPITYNECYNIGFFGLERLHPFDSKKYKRVLALLEEAGVLRADQLVQAAEATHDILREVHTEKYLQNLNSSSFKVAQVTELVPLLLLPPPVLRRTVLRPMATMAGGTMLAAALAMERGWAVNLGGGMHHAYHNDGGGWCPYADINLALRRLRAASGGAARKIMVVDLDVHQGNGVGRCKLHTRDDALYIVDVYGGRLYPWDKEAKQAINQRVELEIDVEDKEYLEAVSGALGRAFAEFQPDLLIYNAGTDILKGDPLGRLGVSEAGVVERDRLVWAAAAHHHVPILMLLSGGYTQASTPCIARSIQALFSEFKLADSCAAAG